MIYFDKVTKKYQDGVKVVNDVTLTIEPEEFVSIVGHSGAGKTTLLKMLMAEEVPTEGVVFFESADVHKIKKSRVNKFRRRIGIVFQDFRLLPNRTAYENVSFAMEAAGRGEQAIASDVPHVLRLVDLGEKMWNFPRELSGGEQQRVAIARAIVNQPDVLIADEPTGNLDPDNTRDIIRILQKINELGTTVVLTTHNRNIIESLGRKRVVTMENGEIVRDKNGGYVL
ncbi:MAG: cell division ATP-binding protein FtsE [Candidatus Pacebacteria bacterium]|nr:cell division ATP-binding protein FtsE [Candidatus Paceibacterota bacterium]